MGSRVDMKPILTALREGRRVRYGDGYAVLEGHSMVRVYVDGSSYLMGLREFIERVDLGRW